MLNQRAFIIPGPDMDGLWDRGVSGTTITKSLQNTCPPLGFTEAKDIRFFPWGFKTRQGYGTSTSNAAWTAIRQVIAYSTNNNVTGALVSGEIILSGTAVYDSASPTPGVAISSVDAPSYYISIITLFGRMYITQHDLSTGIPTFPIVVYIPGSGVVARNAGGDSPDITGAAFASSGTAGNVTQGIHIFGVVYETVSGHLGLINNTGINSVGMYIIANANQQVTATGIPTGAAGVVAKRHIIGSKVITGYSGDPTDYELFFIDTGTQLDDNVTTTATFNFTDESLVDSADYLYDILSFPFPGVGLTWYSNRLVTYGEPYPGFPQALGPSVLRISEPGKPETFSSISGFLEVFKDDGEDGVKNCFEQDGLLVICKTNKTYVTRDNGDEPNTWQVAAVDYTIGSTVFGVTKSLDTTGSSKSGKTIVAGKSGVYNFQGQYSARPLTWKIARRWQKISEDTAYPLTQIIDIPQAQLFLIAVDNTNVDTFPKYFLVADYSRGLDWQNIRWAEWHPVDSTKFFTLKDNTTIHFVSGDGIIRKMVIGTEVGDYANLTDNGSRISNCEVITSEIKFDNLLNKYQIAQLRIRGKATFQTEFKVTLTIGDDSLSATGIPIPSLTPDSASPSPEIIKAIINFSGYYPRAQFTWSGHLLEVRHMIFSGNVTAEDQLTV